MLTCSSLNESFQQAKSPDGEISLRLFFLLRFDVNERLENRKQEVRESVSFPVCSAPIPERVMMLRASLSSLNGPPLVGCSYRRDFFSRSVSVLALVRCVKVLHYRYIDILKNRNRKSIYPCCFPLPFLFPSGNIVIRTICNFVKQLGCLGDSIIAVFISTCKADLFD